MNKIHHEYSEFVGYTYIFRPGLSAAGKFLNVLINNVVNR